jgi:hypothetical protein
LKGLRLPSLRRFWLIRLTALNLIFPPLAKIALLGVLSGIAIRPTEAMKINIQRAISKMKNTTLVDLPATRTLKLIVAASFFCQTNRDLL